MAFSNEIQSSLAMPVYIETPTAEANNEQMLN
jgi:hypothetical protein